MTTDLKFVFLICTVLGVFAQETKPKTCEVARIKAQSNFNLSQFMGEWHVISDKQIFPHQHKLDKVVNVFTNIRVYGVLKASHQVELTVVYRAMGICVTSKLTAERPDFKAPAKLEVSSTSAWWSYMKEAHPVWVIWTDGDAALLYSCGHVEEDGSCNPHQTYSWTINRQSEGHSKGQQILIDDKITQFCMDPADFKDMKRSWPCVDFDVEDLEGDDDDDNEQDDPVDDQTAGDDTADDAEGEEEATEDEEIVDADQEEELTAGDEEAEEEVQEEGGEEEETGEEGEEENAHKAEL